MPNDEASEPIVTVLFRRGDGQRAFVHLKYFVGARLKNYLHHPALRVHSPVSHVLSGALGAYNQHSRRLKLNAVINEGDSIFLGRGA
jgi:hypothetical protein